jgi:hypothetical protein
LLCRSMVVEVKEGWVISWVGGWVGGRADGEAFPKLGVCVMFQCACIYSCVGVCFRVPVGLPACLPACPVCQARWMACGCVCPREASEHFGACLTKFLPSLARSDGSKPFAEQADLPAEIHGAVMTDHGALTPSA